MPEVRCYSVNISEGGMAVSTFVPLSPGEEVQVQFTLPGHKAPFLAESRICWLKTGRLGVRFVSISHEHKSELQDWLSRKLEETLPENRRRKVPEGRRLLRTNLQEIEISRQLPSLPYGYCSSCSHISSTSISMSFSSMFVTAR